MFKDVVDHWPLAHQILHRRDGTGLEARSARTRALTPKDHGVAAARSAPPYGAVECGQLVFTATAHWCRSKGDPESTLSHGGLCPNGHSSFELLTHAGRETRVKRRTQYELQIEIFRQGMAWPSSGMND